MIAPLAALGCADRWLLLKINRDWTAPALDAAMPVITNLHRAPWFAAGVAPVLTALWLWKGRKRALRALIVAALAIGAADQLAHRVIKPWVARPRPQSAGVPVVARVTTGGVYGFPSNHAINAGAAAAVLAVAYPGAAFAFAGVAALIAYSRVYVGAHYPGDVLAGLALGVGIGWPWAALMLGGPGAKKKARSR